VQGVVAGFVELGIDVPPMVAVIRSSVPLGAGLSSSAALEVATATVLEAATGVTLAPVRKALLCQRAEHQFAGVPCGIMDQFSSVLGQQDHLMLLDCRKHRVEMIPFRDQSLTLLVCNSNIHHELASSEYARRRQECRRAAALLGLRSLRDASLPMLTPALWELDETCCRRARHVISENERTRAAATAVSSGRWEQAGRLMLASHASLRDDYAVSCRELDLLVAIAEAIGTEGGVLGARMTGGGFGGCTVNLVRTDEVAAVSQHLSREYEKQAGTRLSLFATRPSQGAGRLDPTGDGVAGMAEGSGRD
jgi:galactokinase